MAALSAWASAAHPFPLAVVLVLTALVGIASAAGAPDARSLTAVLAAMLASQLAIGWSNDYLDRERDALHQSWKPVPSGRLQARRLPPAITIAVGVVLAIGALLGPVPLILLAVGTAAGISYSLGIKDTRWSGVPYLVGLAALPPFVWTSLDVYRGEFLVLYAFGAPLVLAAHLANTLPDLDGDAAAGRRGMAVAVGRGGSLAVLAACMGVAPAIAAAAAVRVGAVGVGLIAGLVAYAVLAGVAAYFYAWRSGRSADVWGFRCVAAAGVALATGWLASI